MSEHASWSTTSHTELLALLWQHLVLGVSDAGHAFHWPTVATTGPDGTAHMRTVVMRHVDVPARRVCFYTDVRSAKVEHISQNDTLSWHIYDASQRVQVRMISQVAVHCEDDVSRSMWASLPASGRYAYSHTPAPGVESAQWHPGPPKAWLEQTPSLEDTEMFYPNFAVCLATINTIEVLHLAAKGHHRARFEYDIGGAVSARWLVP